MRQAQRIKQSHHIMQKLKEVELTEWAEGHGTESDGYDMSMWYAPKGISQTNDEVENDRCNGDSRYAGTLRRPGGGVESQDELQCFPKDWRFISYDSTFRPQCAERDSDSHPSVSFLVSVHVLSKRVRVRDTSDVNWIQVIFFQSDSNKTWLGGICWVDLLMTVSSPPTVWLVNNNRWPGF